MNGEAAQPRQFFKKSQDHNVKSAGTEPSARIKVSSKLIEWADIIFAMEKRHRQRIMEKFSTVASNEKIIILDIPDEYQYMDPELIENINTSVVAYFNNIKKNVN